MWGLTESEWKGSWGLGPCRLQGLRWRQASARLSDPMAKQWWLQVCQLRFRSSGQSFPLQGAPTMKEQAQGAARDAREMARVTGDQCAARRRGLQQRQAAARIAARCC